MRTVGRWGGVAAMALVACVLGGCAVRQKICSIIPVPVPVLCPKACCGDCNADGKVDVAELTKQGSILQGLAPLSSCPAADCNGDGKVTDPEDTAPAKAAAQNGCPK